MPKLSEITAPHQQRADEYGERLKQALKNHIGKSDVRLAGPASSLNPQILNRLVNDKMRSLDALRLTPAIVKRGLDNGQKRLDSLWRLAENLHPDRPLSKGFARITNRSDMTLTSANATRAAQHVSLHFSDGKVDATIEGDTQILVQNKPAAIAPAKIKKAAKPKTSNNQADLFK
jgi:exodeoxyribonuclease VII large subunit